MRQRGITLRRGRRGRLEPFPLSDDQLRAYHRAVATLSLDGAVVGHLASIVGSMVLPTNAPWPWFVIVWSDGTTEPPFEDYGPLWPVVRELEAGYLDHHGPSTSREGRFLGFRVVSRTPGPSTRFEVERLPADAAAQAWMRLGLSDDDF